MRNISILLMPCLFLVACGGGGSTASGGSVQQKRFVPGGCIAMSSHNGAFVVSTSVPAVTSMAVLAGNDYVTAISIDLVQVGPQTWRGAGARGDILVRLMLSDGSNIESAAGDFVVP